MRLLLDTHSFLWFIDDNPHLSSNAKSLLESDNDLLLSTASLWEIAIKLSIGKLALPQPEDWVKELLRFVPPWRAWWPRVRQNSLIN